MRDTREDEEYLRERYNKDNARFTKYITTYQNKINNPEQYDINACKYHAFIFAFNKFYCGYSLGLDLKEFLPEIKMILQNLIDTKDSTESNYEDMEFIIYFIILFNQYEYLNEYKKLLEYSKDRDFYLDSLLQYLDSSWEISTEKINWPKEINPLNEVVQLSKTDKTAAVQRLKKYLDKEWFKTLKEGLVTNKDLEIGNYRGYWCIEAAALVKVLGLDDTELKSCNCYPYDMAHFCK